jgi:DNA-binding transcriptional LysR family regulator
VIFSPAAVRDKAFLTYSLAATQPSAEIRVKARKRRLIHPGNLLSKSIKNLEDELGTPLLVRTRRRVELTPKGPALPERSERIFQELETARIAVKRHSRGEKGLLRIGCEDGTTFKTLPPFLQNFQKPYRPFSAERRFLSYSR